MYVCKNFLKFSFSHQLRVVFLPAAEHAGLQVAPEKWSKGEGGYEIESNGKGGYKIESDGKGGYMKVHKLGIQ